MYELEHVEIRGETIFNAHFSGDLNREVMFELIAEMAVHEATHSGNKLLADFSDISEISIDFGDMKSISGYVKENGKRTGKMAVLIGPNNSRYLFAKLFIDLFNLFRPGQDKAFKTVEQAIDWLCPEKP